MPKPVKDTDRNTISYDNVTDHDDAIVTFWWSEPDWRWYRVTLGEIREESGDPNMDIGAAREYYEANWEMPIKLSPPAGGTRPGDEDEGLRSFTSLREAPGSGRGSGRSGAAARVYVAPNRDELEEQLKSYVVATTGKNDPAVLKRAVDAYMKADKAAWDLQVSGKGGEQPSPFMAAKEVVRGTDAYKTIHYLRPDSVDEMDWVTGTQGKLRQLGLSASRAEELGIAQAKGGSTDEELMRSAETDKLTRNKVMADSQRRRIQDAARSVVSMIK